MSDDIRCSYCRAGHDEPCRSYCVIAYPWTEEEKKTFQATLALNREGKRERVPCAECGAAAQEHCRGNCEVEFSSFTTSGCPGCGAWGREKHDADCEFFGDKAVAERTRGESNVIELRPPPRDTLGCTFYHGCAPHRRRCNAPAAWLLTFAPDPNDQSADDIEPESDDRADAGRPPESRRQERTRAKYSRLLDVLATPDGLRAALRMALGSVVAEWGGTDLWRCMDVLGLDYHDDATPEADAATVPDADVARVLAAILVVGRLDDAMDEDASAAERSLRAMMEETAEAATAKVPTEVSLAPAPAAPSSAAPATCVWIKEKVWDGLADDQQSMLCNPDVAVEEVVWKGRAGHVMAAVRDARTLDALKHVLRERKIKHETLFEGEKIETKRSKKAVK